MPAFSHRSLERLETCHPQIQALMKKVVQMYDCTILEGHRERYRHNELLEAGRTKVQYEDSKHSKTPSEAVDTVSFPIIWPDKKKRPDTYVKDLCRFYLFAGRVQGIADGMGINVRIGADWDGDGELNDQQFDDTPHIELVMKKADEDNKVWS